MPQRARDARQNGAIPAENGANRRHAHAVARRRRKLRTSSGKISTGACGIGGDSLFSCADRRHRDGRPIAAVNRIGATPPKVTQESVTNSVAGRTGHGGSSPRRPQPRRTTRRALSSRGHVPPFSSCTASCREHREALRHSVSIGSNDLTQLTLGIDRDSEILVATEPATVARAGQRSPPARDRSRPCRQRNGDATWQRRADRSRRPPGG
jgi:hypothetical protein